MLRSEFIERTGFQPTYEEYGKIEDAYYEFDGDKDAFCKAFVEGGGEKKVYEARATEIERLRSQIVELEKMFKADYQKQEARIAQLQSDLDKELEWKPSKNSGTNMEQDDYEALARLCDGTHGNPHVMTDDEAKQVIADEFGFSTDRVEIIRTVHTYEVNKRYQLRKAAEYTREPVYDVSDYNYIRFNVRCAGCTWSYEMVNGELMQYSC